jgi:hypothetical protein
MDLRTRRIFEARLAGLAARLGDEGIGREQAERLLERWDDVAYERGIGRLSPAYWTEAPGWVREQVAAERRPTEHPR